MDRKRRENIRTSDLYNINGVTLLTNRTKTKKQFELRQTKCQLNRLSGTNLKFNCEIQFKKNVNKYLFYCNPASGIFIFLFIFDDNCYPKCNIMKIKIYPKSTP